MTARRKKERGRPSRPLPPKIDASPERIAGVVLNAKRSPRFGDAPTRAEYRCQDCDRQVNYPETLHEDGRCEQCHAAASSSRAHG